jgi:cleavage and polyadenylation specificity factor subunit 1
MSCQRSKISRHITTPLGDFVLPTSRSQHVHVDIVGPLPTSDGFRYCRTAVDSFTSWPEAIPMPDIPAETVARALLSGWITRFGCPQNITTDHDRQFESQLFHSLATMCDIHLSRTTAFHPAANGLVERMHRSLKAAKICQAHERWTEAFPLDRLGMRTAFKEDLQASVSELVYGEPLLFQANFWQHRPSPGIHRSSLPSSDATSSNCGQSQRNVTPPQLSLSTRTWQTLPMSSSGRIEYGAPWNRPAMALTRSWPAH